MAGKVVPARARWLPSHWRREKRRNRFQKVHGRDHTGAESIDHHRKLPLRRHSRPEAQRPPPSKGPRYCRSRTPGAAQSYCQSLPEFPVSSNRMMMVLNNPLFDDMESGAKLHLNARRAADLPTSSLSPGSNAAHNILRRCVRPETRDSDRSLPSLHKSRNDAMPPLPLPLRVFAFQNDDGERSRHGGYERRARYRDRRRSNNSPSHKSPRREIASNRQRFAEAKPQPKTRRSEE